MNRRHKFIAIGTAATLAAAALTAWTLTRSGHHTAPAQAVSANPFPVSVSVAGDSPVPVGETVEVHVSAPTRSQLRAATLFDGSRTVASAVVVPGGHGVTFPVSEVAPGEHVFVAHVEDATGVVASSEPHGFVVAVPRGVRTVQVRSLAGESAKAVAARLGVPTSSVHATAVSHRASLRTLAILPAGTPVTVLVPHEPRDPLGAVNAVNIADRTPNEPQITAAVDNCTVTVRTEWTTALEVQTAEAFTGTFDDLGSVDAQHPLTLSNQPAGTLILQARSGDVVTPIVSVDVPDICEQGTWSGTVSIRHGVLLLPSAGGSVYLYLGVDSGTFQRLPADGSLIPAITKAIPISNLIPQLRGSRLVIEAWRAPDAQGTAALIGRGQLDLPAGASMDDAVGIASTLTLSAIQGHDPSTLTLANDAQVPFLLQTDSTVANRLEWQVLAQPLTQNNSDGAPIGLLAEGITLPHNGNAGFVLDTHQLPHSKSGTPGPVESPDGAGYSHFLDKLTPAQLAAIAARMTASPGFSVYIRAIAYHDDNDLGLVLQHHHHHPPKPKPHTASVANQREGVAIPDSGCTQ